MAVLSLVSVFVVHDTGFLAVFDELHRAGRLGEFCRLLTERLRGIERSSGTWPGH